MWEEPIIGDPHVAPTRHGFTPHPMLVVPARGTTHVVPSAVYTSCTIWTPPRVSVYYLCIIILTSSVKGPCLHIPCTQYRPHVSGRVLFTMFTTRVLPSPLVAHLSTSGVYTTRVCVGSPATPFDLIVDTGSFLTSVPCTWCLDCGAHSGRQYDPTRSAMAALPDCRRGTTTAQLNKSASARKRACNEFSTEYAESSAYSGIIISDAGYIANATRRSGTFMRQRFGCITHESGLLYTQPMDGILGLAQVSGVARPSVFDGLPSPAQEPQQPSPEQQKEQKSRMRTRHSHSFSLCLSDRGGQLFLGGTASAARLASKGAIVVPRASVAGAVGYRLRLRELWVERLPPAPRGLGVGRSVSSAASSPHSSPGNSMSSSLSRKSSTQRSNGTDSKGRRTLAMTKPETLAVAPTPPVPSKSLGSAPVLHDGRYYMRLAALADGKEALGPWRTSAKKVMRRDGRDVHGREARERSKLQSTCLVDSGTTHLRLNAPQFREVLGVLRQRVKQVSRIELSATSTAVCTYLTNSTLDALPRLALVFAEGVQQPLVLTPQQYMLHAPGRTRQSLVTSALQMVWRGGIVPAGTRRMCAAIGSNNPDADVVLGAAVLRGTEVVIREDSIAFVPGIDCDDDEREPSLEGAFSLGCPL